MKNDYFLKLYQIIIFSTQDNVHSEKKNNVNIPLSHNILVEGKMIISEEIW